MDSARNNSQRRAQFSAKFVQEPFAKSPFFCSFSQKQSALRTTSSPAPPRRRLVRFFLHAALRRDFFPSTKIAAHAQFCTRFAASMPQKKTCGIFLKFGGRSSESIGVKRETGPTRLHAHFRGLQWRSELWLNPSVPRSFITGWEIDQANLEGPHAKVPRYKAPTWGATCGRRARNRHEAR